MNDAAPPIAACIACGRPDDQVPLLSFAFRGQGRFICSQHLPLLIHDPAKLAALLPGADGLAPSDHDD